MTAVIVCEHGRCRSFPLFGSIFFPFKSTPLSSLLFLSLSPFLAALLQGTLFEALQLQFCDGMTTPTEMDTFTVPTFPTKDDGALTSRCFSSSHKPFCDEEYLIWSHFHLYHRRALNLFSHLFLRPASLALPPAIFVDASAGSDTNQGTKASPFKTIAAAVSHAKANGQIVLRKGTTLMGERGRKTRVLGAYFLSVARGGGGGGGSC